MEQLIEVIMVIFLLPLGMSMAVRPQYWVEWLQTIYNTGISAVLTLAMVYLFFGAFIITFHWVWEGFPIVVTIFALIVILRSIMMLFFPEFDLKLINIFKPQLKTLTSISGFFIVIIAVLLYNEIEVETGLLSIPENMFFVAMNNL